MASTVSGSILALAVVAAWCLLAAAPAAADGCPRRLAQAIPPRAADALTGSDFVRATAGLSEAEREPVIVRQLLAGDLPAFLRRLRPVTLRGAARGRPVRVTICVTPDYLALGSDDDFLRMPMALPTALAVAGRFGFVLPTPKMVDAIYQQADVRLRPRPLPASDRMRSTAYYWWHDHQIREQRFALAAPLGVLVAGDKKDLVITNRLRLKPGRVAIYGWHQGTGRPIQPLSTVHGARYADYSHGVRLVSAIAYVDGRPTPIADLLEDPQLADLLSDEGPITRLAGARRRPRRPPQLADRAPNLHAHRRLLRPATRSRYGPITPTEGRRLSSCGQLFYFGRPSSTTIVDSASPLLFIACSPLKNFPLRIDCNGIAMTCSTLFSPKYERLIFPEFVSKPFTRTQLATVLGG